LHQNIPPHSTEAEQSVLGAVMLNPDMADIMADSLKPEDFYEERNRLIFEAMLSLAEQNKPVDLVTITERLRQMDKVEKAGGVPYIASLTEAVQSARNAKAYAHIIKEKSMLRKMIAVCNDISSNAYSNPSDVITFCDESEHLFLEATKNTIKKDMQTLSDILNDVIKIVSDSQEGLAGISTGFYELNNKCGGFQKGDLIVLAGRPGMGKTSLALKFLLSAGVPAAFFSLEMSKNQVGFRIVCAKARVNFHNIKMGNLSKEEIKRLFAASNELKNTKLYIEDDGRMDIWGIKSKARRLVKEKGVRLIAIDYLQLVGCKKESREREVAEISRQLKSLAKELDIPVIALSQLNRSVEARQDKRPHLADLRESGAIEQDADVVMFLYREKKYNPAADNLAELNIAKQRNGPEGRICAEESEPGN